MRKFEEKLFKAEKLSNFTLFNIISPGNEYKFMKIDKFEGFPIITVLDIITSFIFTLNNEGILSSIIVFIYLSKPEIIFMFSNMKVLLS